MGMAVYPSDSLTPRRGRLAPWWQWPLLPFTFPLSLVWFALSAAIPWLRSRGLAKFVLGFLVIWTVYGLLTVLVDSAAGTDPTDADSEVRDERSNALFPRYSIHAQFQVVPYQEGYLYNNPSWNCGPSGNSGGNWGGWPFGKPFVLVLACDAVIARTILTQMGFEDQGHWVVRQYEITLVDYLVYGRISSAYLFMGLLALIEIFVAVPWFVAWALLQVVKHLRWE